MSWAEIKKSINSNLSKPLDVLINGTKGLVVSDNLYYKIQETDIQISGDDTNKSINLGKRITLNWKGSIRLKYKLFNSSSSYSNNAKLYIYKNGTLFLTITGVYPEPTDYQYTELYLNGGEIYEFVVSNTSTGGSNTTYLKGLSIYANLVDLSGITIMEAN